MVPVHPLGIVHVIQLHVGAVLSEKMEKDEKNVKREMSKNVSIVTGNKNAVHVAFSGGGATGWQKKKKKKKCS